MRLDVFRAHFSQDSGTYVIRNFLSRSGLIRSDTCLPLFYGSRQFMHFHCSKIDDATQQRPLSSHSMRVKPPHEFPPGFQTCASRCVLHHVQCLSFQKLCQCDVYLGIDFTGIRTCFHIFNRQYWGFLLSCPVKSRPRRRDYSCGHVLELERPVLPRCCFGVKIRQFREGSRLDKRSVPLGYLMLNFRPLRLSSASNQTIQ